MQCALGAKYRYSFTLTVKLRMHEKTGQVHKPLNRLSTVTRQSQVELLEPVSRDRYDINRCRQRVRPLIVACIIQSR